MKKKTVSSVAKGVAAGIAVGTATYMASSAMQNKGKTVRRSAGKAIKAVGSIIDTLQG